MNDSKRQARDLLNVNPSAAATRFQGRDMSVSRRKEIVLEWYHNRTNKWSISRYIVRDDANHEWTHVLSLIKKRNVDLSYIDTHCVGVVRVEGGYDYIILDNVRDIEIDLEPMHVPIESALIDPAKCPVCKCPDYIQRNGNRRLCLRCHHKWELEHK
jgi:hypothetical protein